MNKSRSLRLISIVAIILGILLFVLYYYIVPKWLFSDMSYKGQVATEAHLLTKDQLCDLVRVSKINQLSYNNLRNKEIYLAIRMQNTGQRTLTGKVECIVDGISIYELGVGLNARMPNYANYLIPVNHVRIPPDERQPKITIKWQRLYTE